MISFSTGVGEEEIGERETRCKTSSCKRVAGWNVRGGCCMGSLGSGLPGWFLQNSYLAMSDREWEGGILAHFVLVGRKVYPEWCKSSQRE